jgi:hypothetical protein
MHFCMDEVRMIIAAGGAICVLPYCCRWAWFKVKGVFK